MPVRSSTAIGRDVVVSYFAPASRYITLSAQIDVHRQKAPFIVMSVERRELLMAMHHIERVGNLIPSFAPRVPSVRPSKGGNHRNDRVLRSNRAVKRTLAQHLIGVT